MYRAGYMYPSFIDFSIKYEVRMIAKKCLLIENGYALNRKNPTALSYIDLNRGLCHCHPVIYKHKRNT